METVIGNRYQVLEQLGEGAMGVVWLVYDKLRQHQVALKQVATANDAQHLAITREFRILSTLRHPNIVSVLEYGSHKNQPYFTMEYLSDAVHFNEASNQPIERFIQVLQALSYLHRRGILHHDLKPANVLITPDGIVKVLDFGLARDISRNDGQQKVAGTLRYMAPELIYGNPPNTGSDLWAAGIMLCETLTGHPPFDDTTPATLIASVLTDLVDFSGLDPAMTPIVARLLSKDPAGRYLTALDVIHDLCNAAQIEALPESHEQRESFLQAAAFVGRDREWQALTEALQTAAAGNSQLWLVGGEAGVGKSRLLDEVRTQALVDGFIVLQGQGVEGGGLPYQLWREIARQLALGAPMNDLTAGVLKELVPDIKNLLGREVADSTPLDPKAHQDRLVVSLVDRLQGIAAPLLIILEDLHWAAESLDLLKRLWPRLGALPVLIIGSYRNEERPLLPTEFPNAQVLTLERLTPEAVAALSASMIGAENTTPALVKRLAQETEGNALFMVEVVRALAEEAGSLRDIRRITLPDRILAGGMVMVLRRRLSHVPDWALDRLKLAAVLGRVIDPLVLLAAGGDPLDPWLHACAEAAVLEPYSGEWRFSHDRLREVLLQDISPEDLLRLHEAAALALEAVYPDDPSYAEALLDHWAIVGNTTRELCYLIPVINHLVDVQGDYSRAEPLIRRGLTLLPSDDARSVKLHVRLSRICWYRGDAAPAEQFLLDALATARRVDDQAGVSLALINLGNMAADRGDYDAAQTYYEQSLAIRRVVGSKVDIAGSLNNVGALAHYRGQEETARLYYAQSLALYREAGDKRGIGAVLNNLGDSALMDGDYAAARAYAEESLAMWQEIGYRYGISQNLTNLGLLALDQRDYAAALSYFEQSVVLADEMGDKQTVAISGTLIARVQQMLHVPEALITVRQGIELCLSIHAPTTLLDYLVVLASLLLDAGQTTRAAELAGLVDAHPATRFETRQQLDKLKQRLAAMLPPQPYADLRQAGAALDLEDTVQDLLARLKG